jgi:molecular chaperone GrpE
MTGSKKIRVVDRRTFLSADDPIPDDVPEEVHDDKPTYVRLLEERTARAEAQLAQTIDAYKTEAEVELTKTKDRLAREAERELSRLRGDLALELLEVLDNFDRSLNSDSGYEAIRQGLIMVRKQFFSALEGLGISEVPAQGQPFDPNLHKAADTTDVSDPAHHGKVVAVFKAGYALGGRIIRPALVRVGKQRKR